MGRFQTYEPGVNIVEHGEAANRLIMFVSGSVQVFIEHHHHHILDIDMGQGDFIGEMALLGFEDWGESILLGVSDIDIEVAASHDDFAVCLILDASKFERLMESHTISMQYAIHVYKKRRLDHKIEYFEEHVPGFRHDTALISEQIPVAIQRAEARGFIRTSRHIMHWQAFSQRNLHRHHDKPAFDFAVKILKLAGSHEFTQNGNEWLHKHASEILDPRAQEKRRKMNKEQVQTGQKRLEYSSEEAEDEEDEKGNEGSPAQDDIEQQVLSGLRIASACTGGWSTRVVHPLRRRCTGPNPAGGTVGCRCFTRKGMI